MAERNSQTTTANPPQQSRRRELFDAYTAHLGMAMSVEKKDETMREDFPLVVAIDFGTTYSGYGYQFLDVYKRDRMAISYPQPFNGGHPNLLSYKTSTCILLNSAGEFDSFGYESEEKFKQLCISKEHEQFYFFKYFKMKLQEQMLHFKEFDFHLTPENRSNKLPAITVFSLAIKCLKDEALKKIADERRKLDESCIMWALTVPAIWNERATQFMKTAAVKAGIKRENLKIVFEPEAASFACMNLPITISTPSRQRCCFHEVPVGTVYMVVDLGGGTADIVVHKKIDQSRVKEISRPSGGLCGGTAVDSNFILFLKTIVGENAFMRLKEDYPLKYADLMKNFEVTKRDVDQTKGTRIIFKVPRQLSELCLKDTGQSFEEAVRKSKYKDKIMFYENKALIDAEIFYGFFEPVTQEIVKHVEHILDTQQGSQVTLLLMVGGFSESKYVQNIMKSKFQNENRDVLIPNDPGLSVLKGAVVFAREEKLLAFRIRDVSCVTALHIGQNMVSMAIQFKTNSEEKPNPNSVFAVMFPGPNGGQTTYTSDCVLIDPTMKVDSVGNKAEEKYNKLCKSSEENGWHFFKDFYLQLEEQEDKIEFILKDQENVPTDAIAILTIFITHALNNLKTQCREKHVYDLTKDTHFVLTAPANWNERTSLRLLSDAARRAGLKEENITIVLESEAINQYCKTYELWEDFNVADAPIGSIVVIANLAEIKGEVTFHEKRSMGTITGAYKTVSGDWGTRSLSDGLMEILGIILGLELMDKFKRKYPTIYNDLCKTIMAMAKRIRLHQTNSANLRFPVKTFDELCRKNLSQLFRECVERSEYSPKIKVVSSVKLGVDVSLFDGIIGRVTDPIVGLVKKEREDQMCQGIKSNWFFILTGGFSDYEMLKAKIVPELKNLDVEMVIIRSDHCPVLKGAIAYGFTCG